MVSLTEPRSLVYLSLNVEQLFLMLVSQMVGKPSPTDCDSKKDEWNIEDTLFALVKQARDRDAELDPPADDDSRRYTYSELEEVTRRHVRLHGSLAKETPDHRKLIEKHVFESNYLRSFIGKWQGFFQIIPKKRPVIRIAFWTAHPIGEAYAYGTFMDPNGRACIRHAHDIVRGVARLLKNQFEVIYVIYDFSRFPPTGKKKTLTLEEFQTAIEESVELRAAFHEFGGFNFDITTLQSQTISVVKHGQVVLIDP